MTQDSLLLLLFKIIIIVDLVTLAVFVGDYTRLAPWWRNPIGRTVVIKDILLGAAFTPTLLSLFFQFNRLSSRVAAWVDLSLFTGIAIVMVWRTIVFQRVSKRDRKPEEGSPDGRGKDGPAERS